MSRSPPAKSVALELRRTWAKAREPVRPLRADPKLTCASPEDASTGAADNSHLARVLGWTSSELVLHRCWWNFLCHFFFQIHVQVIIRDCAPTSSGYTYHGDEKSGSTVRFLLHSIRVDYALVTKQICSRIWPSSTLGKVNFSENLHSCAYRWSCYPGVIISCCYTYIYDEFA